MQMAQLRSVDTRNAETRSAEDNTTPMYPCTYPGCLHSFHLRCTMVRHQRLKHGSPRSRPVYTRRSWKISDKPFSCCYPGCSRRYFSDKALQRHLATHLESNEPAYSETTWWMQWWPREKLLSIASDSVKMDNFCSIYCLHIMHIHLFSSRFLNIFFKWRSFDVYIHTWPQETLLSVATDSLKMDHFCSIYCLHIIRTLIIFIPGFYKLFKNEGPLTFVHMYVIQSVEPLGVVHKYRHLWKRTQRTLGEGVWDHRTLSPRKSTFIFNHWQRIIKYCTCLESRQYAHICRSFITTHLRHFSWRQNVGPLRKAARTKPRIVH